MLSALLRHALLLVMSKWSYREAVPFFKTESECRQRSATVRASGRWVMGPLQARRALEAVMPGTWQRNVLSSKHSFRVAFLFLEPVD